MNSLKQTIQLNTIHEETTNIFCNITLIFLCIQVQVYKLLQEEPNGRGQIPPSDAVRHYQHGRNICALCASNKLLLFIRKHKIILWILIMGSIILSLREYIDNFSINRNYNLYGIIVYQTKNHLDSTQHDWQIHQDPWWLLPVVQKMAQSD